MRLVALRGGPGFRGVTGALPVTALCSEVSRYRPTRSFSGSSHSYLDSYSTGVQGARTCFDTKKVTYIYNLHHIKWCKKCRPERKQAGTRARESPASASSKNAETGLTNSAAERAETTADQPCQQPCQQHCQQPAHEHASPRGGGSESRSQ